MQLRAIHVLKPLSFRLLALGAALGGLALASCAGDAAAVGGRIRREWKLEPARKPSLYRLVLRETDANSNWMNSREVAPAQIHGLGPGGLRGDQDEVTLRFERDAGTIVARGAIRDGHGQGSFEIELSPAYAAELERRGVGRPTAGEHKHLLHADVPLAFLDDLKSSGYPVPTAGLLVRCADHGVDQAFVRGMTAAGYRLDSIEPLIRARDHGVDPEYIQTLADAGYARIPMPDLLRARDHGVDGRYLAQMRAAGYDRLTLLQAIRARDHGVDGAFAKRVHRREGRTVSLDELIRVRDLGG